MYRAGLGIAHVGQGHIGIPVAVAGAYSHGIAIDSGTRDVAGKAFHEGWRCKRGAYAGDESVALGKDGCGTGRGVDLDGKQAQGAAGCHVVHKQGHLMGARSEPWAEGLEHACLGRAEVDGLAHDQLAVDEHLDWNLLVVVGGAHERRVNAQEPEPIAWRAEGPGGTAPEAARNQPSGGLRPADRGIRVGGEGYVALIGGGQQVGVQGRGAKGAVEVAIAHSISVGVGVGGVGA